MSSDDRRARRPRGVEWFPWLVLVLLLARLPLAWTITVHDDERHYALDGLWVKADLPAREIFGSFLRGHVHPHRFYDPTANELRVHGATSTGYPRPDDRLGTMPRAGHPALFALLVGLVLAWLPESWILANDHCVYLARSVALIVDAAGTLCLYFLMRRAFGSTVAGVAGAVWALLPYGLLFGSLAYLEAPVTTAVVVAITYYVTRVRPRPSTTRFAVLGLLVAAALLMKGTGLIVLPLLACFAVALPCALPPVSLVRRSAVALGVALVAVAALCSPLGLVAEFRDPSAPHLGSVVDPGRVGENFAILFHPSEHRYVHVGKLRHGDDTALDSRFLLAYDVTTPAFFLLFFAGGLVLAARRNWRLSLLTLVLLVFLGTAPIHAIVRRFHVLMPFATFLMAAAWVQLRGRGSSIEPPGLPPR